MHTGLLTLMLPLLTQGFLGEGAVPAAGEEADLERVLTGAGLKTDGEALVTFFRQRTLSSEDRRKLADTIRRLGDEAYEVRRQASADLVAAGAAAVRFLQEALT